MEWVTIKIDDIKTDTPESRTRSKAIQTFVDFGDSHGVNGLAEITLFFYDRMKILEKELRELRSEPIYRSNR